LQYRGTFFGSGILLAFPFSFFYLARWQNVHLLKDVPAVNPVFTIVFIVIAKITIWNDFKQCIVTKRHLCDK